ncbi:MAG: 30S ribosome-binding factor RbfA [Rickettsiales bacterium]|jgi:ribosome-binding factor A|nr:30S ribosome-binding factor RbfA [Rickettsiales bacterium]
MTKLHDLFSSKSSGNQRPLRVAEEIRHAISEVLIRGEVHSVELMGASITVSEVRIGADMKNASVYIMPLNGEMKEERLEALRTAAPEIRYLVSKKVKLRYMPKLHFALDNSFEEAQRINSLLQKPEVIRDLNNKP